MKRKMKYLATFIMKQNTKIPSRRKKNCSSGTVGVEKLIPNGPKLQLLELELLLIIWYVYGPARNNLPCEPDDASRPLITS